MPARKDIEDELGEEIAGEVRKFKANAKTWLDDFKGTTIGRVLRAGGRVYAKATQDGRELEPKDLERLVDELREDGKREGREEAKAEAAKEAAEEEPIDLGSRK